MLSHLFNGGFRSHMRERKKNWRQSFPSYEATTL